ncbi:MAG: Glycosyl transferase, family 2 [Microgenomates group bacterium GW2011_GWC2_45_8]|nr:MAG: Glycosyl transferase, family 2 [Microgenomates group bacterium GW2011_GWC2_45_8]
MSYRHVAIIIPIYNELDNILTLIDLLLMEVPGANIFIVDDNSPDGSALAIEKSFGKNKKVHLLKGVKKMGRGNAVFRGFFYAYQKCPSQVFVEMDADHSHEPQLVPHLVDLVTPDTVVCASRYLKKSKITGWSRTRIIFSELSNFVIKNFLDSPLTDSTNGFRAYPKKAIQVFQKYNLLTSNYLVLSETMALLTNHNFKFLEVPSHFPNRTIGKSNATPILAIKSLLDLVIIWWHYKLWKK